MLGQYLFQFHFYNCIRVIDDSGNVIFCWSEDDKGWILAGYFYGYIVLQVVGGSLAEKYGTKIVLGATTIFIAILTLLIPVASKSSMWMIFAVRVFQGLAAGVTYPCLPPMISRWVTKSTLVRDIKHQMHQDTIYNLCVK